MRCLWCRQTVRWCEQALASGTPPVLAVGAFLRLLQVHDPSALRRRVRSRVRLFQRMSRGWTRYNTWPRWQCIWHPYRQVYASTYPRNPSRLNTKEKDTNTCVLSGEQCHTLHRMKYRQSRIVTTLGELLCCARQKYLVVSAEQHEWRWSSCKTFLPIWVGSTPLGASKKSLIW